MRVELLAKLAFSTRSLVDYLVPMVDHSLEFARMPDEVAKLVKERTGEPPDGPPPWQLRRLHGRYAPGW